MGRNGLEAGGHRGATCHDEDRRLGEEGRGGPRDTSYCVDTSHSSPGKNLTDRSTGSRRERPKGQEKRISERTIIWEKRKSIIEETRGGDEP